MNKQLRWLSIAVILGSLLLNAQTLQAQGDYLNILVSLDIQDDKLSDALFEIGEQGGFAFSYNSEIIPGDRLVSITVTEVPVQTVLEQLLDEPYRYKEIGNHLIILQGQMAETPRAERKQARNQAYLIQGYIFDSRTGEKIFQASVYEVEGFRSAITDYTGSYSIELPANQESKYLSFSKVGYLDTVVIVKPVEAISLNIALTPKPDYLESRAVEPANGPNIHDRTLVAALVPKKSMIMADNVQVEEKRIVQVSFLPYLGTNQLVTGLITNRFSFNILAGYSGGVDGLELGGFQNIVRGTVKGVQLAGFGNIVGGSTQGFQGSGFYNVSAGPLTGVQASGFANVALDTIRGTQLAGFSNTLRGPMYGVQASGFVNFTSEHVDGLQATGFVNIALKDVRLSQLSGFANYCRSVDGVQASGFANYAKDVEGLQATGFVNVASGTNSGFQAAGFVNYATVLDGYQVSVINIADTVSSGVPIGVFSFVRKGLHEVEISSNELFWLNTGFKTGTNHLYNIFLAGLNAEWGYAGYGLGTQFNLSQKFSLGLELSSRVIADLSFDEIIGHQHQLALHANYQLFKHFALFAGASLNLMGSSQAVGQLDVPLVLTKPIYSRVVGNSHWNAWPGFFVGMRF